MNLTEDWYQTVSKFNVKDIPYEDFIEEKVKIGRGTFGNVYKAKCNSIGTVAIKKFSLTNENKKNEECIENFTRELKNYSRIKHERIIQFYGISRHTKKESYFLILEYANQKTLRDFLTNDLEWKERKRLAIQIAEGLRYLHDEADITHRDLHTRNILVNDGNIKISDFGFSRNLSSTTSFKNRFIGVIPFIDVQKVISDDVVLDKRSDIYSFGVVLWEISSCRVPFSKVKGEIALINNIKKGYKEKPVKGTPTQYIDIYTSCWKLKRDSRPLIEIVLSRLQSMQLSPVLRNSDENSEEYLIEDSDGISQNEWIQNAIKEGFLNHIRWNELSDRLKVGSGTFGSVLRASWSKKKTDYVAIKVLFDSDNIRHEIQMINRAHTCENVIRFFGITKDPLKDCYCIIMEYADDGDLIHYLKKKFSSLNWENKYQLAFDITNGVRYLHENDIIHRDLHGKNIVIRKGKAKITDFGLARKTNIQTSKREENFGAIPYIAPELLQKDKQDNLPFSKKADIYSLGVLLWVLSSGRSPFEGNKSGINIIIAISNGKREEIIEGTSPDYYNLYCNCWDGNPENRSEIGNVYNKLKSLLLNKCDITTPRTDDEGLEGSIDDIQNTKSIRSINTLNINKSLDINDYISTNDYDDINGHNTNKP